MREIKFRAWNQVMEKMFTWNEFLNTNMKNTFIAPESTAMILMQYTGTHDENGKEIYEGDIVKFKHRDITIMAPVKYGEWQESKCDEYDCPHYGYYIDYKWDNYCENTGFDLYEKIVEVVGNIYENPELLKGVDNIEL